MTAKEARHLINTEGREHTLVVYFAKKDGTIRRMVCRYAGSPNRSPERMTVWDIEAGGWRQVSLRTVTSIKVLSARADREPSLSAGSDFEAVVEDALADVPFSEVRERLHALMF